MTSFRLVTHESDPDTPYEVLGESNGWYWLQRQGTTDPSTWRKDKWSAYEPLPYPIGTELVYVMSASEERSGRYEYLGRFGFSTNDKHAIRDLDDKRVYETNNIHHYSR